MKCFVAAFLVVIVYLNNVAANIKTYYLAPDCGKTIDLPNEGVVILKLIAGKVQPEMNCYRLITSPKADDRILLLFKDIDIAWSKGCSMDWLELHDGTNTSAPYVSGFKGPLCGNIVIPTVQSTRGNNLFVRFRSGKKVLSKGFDLYIMRYHTGQCKEGEHRCKNGHCISKNLVCNGWNPCGDYSDCPRDPALKFLRHE